MNFINIKTKKYKYLHLNFLILKKFIDNNLIILYIIFNYIKFKHTIIQITHFIYALINNFLECIYSYQKKYQFLN